MSKTKKLILLSVGSVLTVPVTAAFGMLTLGFAWAGAFVGIAALIGIAFAVEHMRKRVFFDTHICVFNLCAYLPGLAASIIICAVMLNLPRSPNDTEGWGALARGIIALTVAAAQGALTMAGIAVALNANDGRKK